MKKSMMAPDNSDGLLVWDSCLACSEGSEENCVCPACCVGYIDDCWCCNGVPTDFGVPGPEEGEYTTQLTDGGAMAKAKKLMALNQAVRKAKNLLSETIVSISKGWLPSGVSQNDLNDSDFLWVSDAYKSGKITDKSAGRKLPIAVHGKVNVDGWLAAWAVLHGSQGGANFAGGPSKKAVMAKLMARKPSGVTVTDGHATRTSTKKAVAIKKDVVLTDSVKFIEIFKADVRLGVILGKASIANMVDHEGDIISEDELEKAAYDFMANENKRATNTHGDTIPGIWVASYVEKGTWYVGFKPDDIQVAIDAANGKFVGFSIGGTAVRIPVTYDQNGAWS